MRWIVEYLKPLKLRLLIGTLIKIIGTLAELLIPFLLTYIVKDGGVISSSDPWLIGAFGLIMALCAVVACVGNVVANRMAARTTMLFATEMRKNLFSSTLRLSAKRVDEFTLPSLEARITSDTYNVQNFVGMIQRMGIRAPILLLGGIGITMAMDFRLSLVMMATLPFIFVLVFFVSRRGVRLYSGVQRSVDGMVRVVREDVQGIRVVKALSKTDYESRRYDEANRALCKSEIRAGRVMGVMDPIMNMLMNLGIVAVVLCSAFFVSDGLSEPATVIAFMQYFTLVSMAMMSLSRMFVMFTRCAASSKRISEVLKCESELMVLPDDGAGDATKHISFEGVSFSYKGGRDNLSDVSFSLKKGQTLGIIGATGSGKTTLIRLLMRTYDVDGGVVRINGRDIRSYSKEELTAMFGVALQKDFLYDATIEENIRFGRELTDEQVERAARIAQAQDFITSFPEGYYHRVTTGGTNLSGGQRQRLLIARAIANNPEILILDDSSSALDYKTDANLRSALASSMPDSTVITVAQRVSSVKSCELILVLDRGEIIGCGTHEELMRDCEVYREIGESQMGGAILD